MTPTPLERLVAVLADRGITVTADQAEAMAVRLEGSVDRYLAFLERVDTDTADYRPLAGEASEKMAEPVSYDLQSPTQAGLPDNQP